MQPSRKFSGSFAVRAVTSAEKLDIEPPLVRMPRAPSGYPKAPHNHRITSFSIAANTGAGFHRFMNRLTDKDMKSAIAAANRPPPGMKARYPGLAGLKAFAAP